MKQKNILILFIICILTIYSNSYSCTTFIFRYDNHIYFGRNLDWITGNGLIMTNLSGLKKTALVDSTEKPISWLSKFGSITFNQVGKDLPYGGINEAGLVVEHMTLEKTIYPARDERSSIGACQWIQFQLDNYSTVEEVIQSDNLIRIVDAQSKFHFLICDRFGHSAVIEFLNGEMVYHTSDSLPFAALANSTYDESLECLNNKSLIQTDRSLYNFFTAAKMIEANSSEQPVEYAFDILKSVSQGPSTKWSIVYDITDLKLYIRVFETPMIVGQNKIFFKNPGEYIYKFIDIKNFTFDCKTISQVIDIENSTEGEVSESFVDYTTSLNKEYISKTFNFFKGWGNEIAITDDEINYLAKYPESFECVDH